MTNIVAPAIVLLTDFGATEYAGMLRGILASNAPGIPLFDLSHNVSPQSVIEGNWILYESFRCFPKGSVFLAVVDPGVGTNRGIIAVKTSNYWFVAPDNGLLDTAILADGLAEIWQIPISQVVSSTFHGRDVMAPVAAQISKGETGKDWQKISFQSRLDLSPTSKKGIVVKIDSFGNIITNLVPSKTLRFLRFFNEVTGLFSMPVHRTYEEMLPDQPAVLTGSAATIEIAVKNGSANSFYPELTVGQKIEVASHGELEF
jgi:hypothetical protein